MSGWGEKHAGIEALKMARDTGMRDHLSVEAQSRSAAVICDGGDVF